MKVLQVLPALHSGGVERGTVELAAELVRRGHESYVLSAGGPMAEQLESEGSHHVSRPIHRKSLASLGQILPVRRLLRELRPDVVHIRSRMPAWIVYLAWKGLPVDDRPVLISTFHGMYSVNPYSAVMAKAEHLIAVSECVRNYIIDAYKVEDERITVIQRGVNTRTFRDMPLDPDWRRQLLQEHPQLRDRKILLMPGRLSRWKGQLTFLDVMARLVRQDDNLHGVIVGGLEGGKQYFMQELESRRTALKLDRYVTFLGQRSDMHELYLFADLVCHLSTKPEPFGRTLTEALASGTPVVAFERGGAAETLGACFPQGLVPPDDIDAFVAKASDVLTMREPALEIPERFRLEAQTEATLAVYRQVLARHGKALS
ncbi:glycosyltransferase family 4 protein [Marinobacter nanhaiticus D15-8W]|uniref:Glycosyltransferase n=1 Tax=Marinobacter nanhaiticus D15-8W TaxID=626887 RepID=N6WNF0_9GAMM|nr:glycosyltransferase family 4 protein [Marinobacter nanhaiticus]ENO12577.1 glycosyltransferase [Marinobacter nanhaiticus D15-8W]BES69914.1 glycosyltransferase family 4 protein [Marinobacter nanhaiticus D15-8W]